MTTNIQLAECAAYHEAGHAIISLSYRLPIGDLGVFINPDGTGAVDSVAASPGYLAAVLNQGGSQSDIHRLEAECIVALAGPLSEYRFRGLCFSWFEVVQPRQGNEDFVRAQALIEAVQGRAGIHRRYQHHLLGRTKRYLRERRTWAAIVHLALELMRLRRVGSERVEAIFRQHSVPLRRFRLTAEPAV